MIIFCDVSDKLHDPNFIDILSCCLFDQSPASIEKALHTPGELFFGWIENSRLIAVCGFLEHEDRIEICHLAVANFARGRGVGKAMVSALDEAYCMTIEAKTYDEAVGFYRKCGFDAFAFIKSYYGIKYQRYRCVRKL